MCLFLSIIGDLEGTSESSEVEPVTAKTQLKRVSFSDNLIQQKTYQTTNHQSSSDEAMEANEEQSNETKPNFILGDNGVENGVTVEEDALEATDDFSSDMQQQNGAKQSTYEKNLIEKRRRLR